MLTGRVHGSLVGAQYIASAWRIGVRTMRPIRMVDAMLVYALGFYAVVGRIAKVPFGVRGAAWLVSHHKRELAVKKDAT